MAQERPDLKQYVGRQLTVIAWLWARTVKSPNPAFTDVDVPLVWDFTLSTKKDKEVYVEPVIEDGSYYFTIRLGLPPAVARNGTKIARGSFKCLFSGVPIRYEYIDDEANVGRIGKRLMAIVAEGDRERVYLPPTPWMESIAHGARPMWKPEATSRGTWASNAQGRRYGFYTFGDYFTERQLTALSTLSDLVTETQEHIRQDAMSAGMVNDNNPLRDGGVGAMAYAEAVGVYLAFAIDKGANYWSTICTWHRTRHGVVSTFGRQGIPMVWDFAEANPLSDSSGNLQLGVEQAANLLLNLGLGKQGSSIQADATSQIASTGRIVSTDPPYYDNISYADLSDFFYVWLRRSLRSVFPDLFATLTVPKSEELVATPYRHGSKEKAEAFFLDGMTHAMHRFADQAHSLCLCRSQYTTLLSKSESVWETWRNCRAPGGRRFLMLMIDASA